MAPELVTQLIVLDLKYHGNKLLSTRHLASFQGKDQFLVKWYPLRRTPKGFQSVADGAVFVPDEIQVDKEIGVGIQCTPSNCSYQDAADMLVLLLPRGRKLSWCKHQMPSAAKEFAGRLAVYWLRPDKSPLIEVVWSLPSSDALAETDAANINAALGDERAKIPNFSVDNYAHYDVALSYASEDRKHAEEIAKALQSAGKHVFFDHDVRSRLWGKGLSEELNEIYSKRATFCVLLVSDHYKNKRWTMEELRAAVNGAARSGKSDFILPVQLDTTSLEELPEDIVYIHIKEGSENISEDIIAKLDRT